MVLNEIRRCARGGLTKLVVNAWPIHKIGRSGGIRIQVTHNVCAVVHKLAGHAVTIASLDSSSQSVVVVVDRHAASLSCSLQAVLRVPRIGPTAVRVSLGC